MTAPVAVDRLLRLLVVVQDDRLLQRMGSLLLGIGAVHLLTGEITAEQIAFAHRVADAVLLIGVDDPLGLLAYLRLAGVDLPIIVFRNGRVGGCEDELLASGAAACAPIPRRADRLVSVVSAVLDEARGAAPAGHELALDPVGLTVHRREATARFTPREFALLQCLVARAGTPVSIARLQAHAWGETLPRQSASQIVTVYVHQIRRKLRGLGLREAIATVRNFGYVFRPPSPRAPEPASPVRRGASGPASPPPSAPRPRRRSRPAGRRR